MRLRDGARLLSRRRSCARFRRGGAVALPYRLEALVTYACDSRCRVCNIWRRYADEPEARRRELSAGEWGAVFRSLGRELLWLSLGGGEPFMRDDLAEIAAAAARSCPDLFLLTIGTNGLDTGRIARSTEALLGALPDRVELHVVVSLDGPAATHDRLRGVEGAHARAEGTCRALGELSARGPGLHVSREVTVSEGNLGEAPGLVRSLRSAGTPFVVTFAQDAPVYNQPERVGLAALSPARVREAAARVASEAGWGLGRLALMRWLYLGLARRFFAEPGRQVLPCHSGWASLDVDPYGSVRPCIMMEDSLGELREHGLDVGRVVASERARRVREAILEDRCPHCWTPCEAYQTMVQEPWRAAWRAARA